MIISATQRAALTGPGADYIAPPTINWVYRVNNMMFKSWEMISATAASQQGAGNSLRAEQDIGLAWAKQSLKLNDGGD